MEKAILKAWDEKSGTLRDEIKSNGRGIFDYETLLKVTLAHLFSDEDWEVPDPERIHRIDDGDYQGTLLFLVASKGYQPSEYYLTKVSYGSCSGCDTMQSLESDGWEDGGNVPNDKQTEGLWTLALHMMQGMKIV